MVGAGAGVATSGSAGLGLAWRLVAQLVVAAASLSHDQLQPAQPSEQGEIFCSLFFLGETDHLGR